MKRINYNNVAKLFSPAKFDILSSNNEDEILKLLDEISLLYNSKKDITILNAYKHFYKTLSKSYRNEYFYRNELFKKIVLNNHNLNSCTSIPELTIGDSKIDLAVFNGTSTGYEIKSDVDSTYRIHSQIEDYSNFFEYLYIVTNSKIASKIQLNNSNIGIIILEEDNSFNILKEAKSNFDNIKMEYLFNSLRKEEYISIVENYFNLNIDLPNTKIRNFCYNLFMNMDKTDAFKFVLNSFNNRKLNDKHIHFINSSSECIKTITLGKKYNLKKCETIKYNLKRTILMR